MGLCMGPVSLGSTPSKGKAALRQQGTRPDALLRSLPGPGTLIHSPVPTTRTSSPGPMRPSHSCLSMLLLAAAVTAAASDLPIPSPAGAVSRPASSPAAVSPARTDEGTPASPSPGTTGAELAAATPARPATGALRRPVLLPDSVLLRINGREDVTRRRYARAVRLLGGNPDSLTPGDRDRFLELVVEQRLLAERARRDARPWAHADSMQFLAERDNVLLRAALSEEFTRIEERRRAQGLPDLDETAMGIAARESLMVELKPVYDDDLLKVVGSYFAELKEATPDMSPQQQIALTKQVPAIPAADTNKVLARSRLGEFRVRDLLDDWRRLTSIYRPHVKDDEGVRALVQNSLFERLIRESAERPELARRPVVASVIADRDEYHAVSTYLQREVVQKIATDSLTLLGHYQRHKADFDRPAHASIILMNLDNERAADSLARRFTIPGEAESLAFRAQRSGIRYTLEVTAESDSALYQQVLATGVGGVAGPERGDAGWRLFKVIAIEPRSSRPFDEVRPMVERSWYETESERMIRALLNDLKRRARLERNERALRAIALPAAPAKKASRR